MATTYGTKQYGSTVREVDEGEPMVPGKIYEAEYQVTGIRTLIPGWENDVVNQITNNLSNQGAEVVYTSVSGSSVTVQWKYSQRYGEFQAAVLPVIAVYAIAFVVITICVYILSLTLVGFVKELGNAVAESPQVAMITYAIIGIAFLYLISTFRSEQKKTAIIAAGAAAGAAQALILRKFMDPTTPTLVPQLGTFGKPSAILGIAGGVGAIVLSMFVLKDHPYVHAITAYGGAALVTGILSGAEGMI